MKIEILYFDECPNHGPTVERVKDALRQEGQAADVVEVNVRDDATARRLGFLGSPTVRIDGLDIEPSARLSKHFGLMCRTYADGSKQVGIPPLDLIRTALREATKGQPGTPDCCQAPTAMVPSSDPSTSKRRGLLLGASVAAAIGHRCAAFSLFWRPRPARAQSPPVLHLKNGGHTCLALPRCF